VNIQLAFSEHSVNIQWTFSEHSVNIQWTFSDWHQPSHLQHLPKDLLVCSPYVISGLRVKTNTYYSIKLATAILACVRHAY
jgi:hypothetical protein